MKNLFAGIVMALGLWLAGGREAQAQLSFNTPYSYQESVTIWVDSIVSNDTVSPEETRVTVRATNGTFAIVDFWTPTPQPGLYYIPPPMSADSRDEMLTLVRTFRANRSLYWTLQFRGLNHWSWARNFYDACRSSETYLEVIEPVRPPPTDGNYFQGGMSNVVVRGSGNDFGELELWYVTNYRDGVAAHIRFLRTARRIDNVTYAPMSHAQMMNLLETLLAPRPWLGLLFTKFDIDGWYVAVSGWSLWWRE